VTGAVLYATTILENRIGDSWYQSLLHRLSAEVTPAKCPHPEAEAEDPESASRLASQRNSGAPHLAFEMWAYHST